MGASSGGECDKAWSAGLTVIAIRRRIVSASAASLAALTPSQRSSHFLGKFLHVSGSCQTDAGVGLEDGEGVGSGEGEGMGADHPCGAPKCTSHRSHHAADGVSVPPKADGLPCNSGQALCDTG